MAVDDALLGAANGHARPVLRFYGWDRPAVSIGYVQRLAAAPAAGYTVVRRPTGGGVVWHDADLTYSVVVPALHFLARTERMSSYRMINQAVHAGLRQLGVPAELADQRIPATVDRATMLCFRHATRYDIVVGSRKIAGSAQRRTRAGLLHQGSVCLGDESPFSRQDLSRALQDGFVSQGIRFEPFRVTAELMAAAESLVRERYGKSDWNSRR